MPALFACGGVSAISAVSAAVRVCVYVRMGMRMVVRMLKLFRRRLLDVHCGVID